MTSCRSPGLTPPDKGESMSVAVDPVTVTSVWK